MSESYLNFFPVGLVWASVSLPQKQRLNGGQCGVQSESFGTSTSSSHTKHDWFSWRSRHLDKQVYICKLDVQDTVVLTESSVANSQTSNSVYLDLSYLASSCHMRSMSVIGTLVLKECVECFRTCHLTLVNRNDWSHRNLVNIVSRAWRVMHLASHYMIIL